MAITRGIAFKLIASIVVSSAVVFALVFWGNYRFIREIIEKNVESDAGHLVSAKVNRVQTVLGSAEKIPGNLSYLLENNRFSAEELVTTLCTAVGRNPELFGAAIAFEPRGFKKDELYFAPYCYRSGNRVAFKQLGSDSYNYFFQDWYQLPKELNRPVWSEPYHDEGGGNVLMATYSVPFYRTVMGEREFAGVVTADVSLEWLREIVSNIKVLKSGYGTLISKNGTIVTHPVKSMIMNETIFSIAEERGDPRVREIGRRMIRGETGFIPYQGDGGVDSFMYFAPIPSNGWTLAVIFPKAELFDDIRRLNNTVLFLGLAGILLLSLVVVLIANSITRPLRAMAAAAAVMGRGDLDVLLPRVSSGDEVGVLTASFESMKTSLKAYIAELTRTTASKERIESELNIAHDIQMSILRRFFPPFPDRKEFDIYALIEPAKEVGGDFYDFFFIDDVHFCFVIADVSGKGIPASLFMAITKTLIKATATTGIRPDQILSSVNNELSEENEACMFVTIFCGILNTETGEVLYANGGHNPPVVLRRSDGARFLDVSSGMVIGVRKDFPYTSERILLRPGDALFMYTDGVTEATNGRLELFSEERLVRQLEKRGGQPAQQVIGGIMEEIVFFAEDIPQSDDIAMMMIVMGSPTRNPAEAGPEAAGTGDRPLMEPDSQIASRAI